MRVTREQIRTARLTCLAEFLLQQYPDEFTTVGNSVVNVNNRSFSVSWEFPGYTNFKTGDSGNPIDFLVKYKKFSFVDAVYKLCKFQEGKEKPAREVRDNCHLPWPGHTNEQVCFYLKGRGIPDDTISRLLYEKLLYQDQSNNAVFVTPQGDYCEIRGTGKTPFYGCRKEDSNRFWFMKTCDSPKTAYICEGAIDAISLSLLHGYEKTKESVYISVGCPGNQRAIDRIKKRIHTVLAVDNDEEGEKCRKKNADLEFILPSYKDWNEDLLLLEDDLLAMDEDLLLRNKIGNTQTATHAEQNGDE